MRGLGNHANARRKALVFRRFAFWHRNIKKLASFLILGSGVPARNWTGIGSLGNCYSIHLSYGDSLRLRYEINISELSVTPKTRLEAIFANLSPHEFKDGRAGGGDFQGKRSWCRGRELGKLAAPGAVAFYWRVTEGHAGFGGHIAAGHSQRAIISTNSTGAVGGVLPSSFTVSGNGIEGGTTASLQINNGTLDVVVTPPSAHITRISLIGMTLTIGATNGPDGGQYRLLESTNVALPLSQWTPILTNYFDAGGNLNLSTHILNPRQAVQFYILSE
jgi:hypothetical protein